MDRLDLRVYAAQTVPDDKALGSGISIIMRKGRQKRHLSPFL